LVVWASLIALNRLFRVMSLIPYLLGGAVVCFLILKSGVHAKIVGVTLAFALPFSARDGDREAPSHKLEHFLHKPVAFIILPIFALANTGIIIQADWMHDLTSANSGGITASLIAGKPLGVACFASLPLRAEYANCHPT
jgi:NhaA family Na+:H+ antiporter